jgi:hypothetical protein
MNFPSGGKPVLKPLSQSLAKPAKAGLWATALLTALVGFVSSGSHLDKVQAYCSRLWIERFFTIHIHPLRSGTATIKIADK